MSSSYKNLDGTKFWNIIHAIIWILGCDNCGTCTPNTEGVHRTEKPKPNLKKPQNQIQSTIKQNQ